MKTKYYLLLFLNIFLIQIHTSGQDPDIQAIVDQVSGDTVFKHISVLQEFDRQTLKNHRECTDYVHSCLSRFNLDTIYYQEMEFDWSISDKDSLYTSLPNIIAIKYGERIPDSIYVIGAHYDAPWVLGIVEGEYTLADIPTSPAADDNASGTSGVLEISRVLSGYSPERTIMFILFAAEEIGVEGSEIFIDNYSDKGKILGMINLDMIAYSSDKENPFAVIKNNSLSKNIFNCCTTSISKYVPDLEYGKNTDEAGDHCNFWKNNIPAISFIDGQRGTDSFNPYIHTLADTIGCSANDTVLAELITKAVVATLLELDTKEYSAYDKTLNLDREFKIYPNPSNGFVYIEFECLNTYNSKIEILNLQGQIIKTISSKSNGSIIDISDYSKGFYFIRIGQTIQKLIKI